MTACHKSSGNIFEDIGFTSGEAAELTAKSRLISAIRETMERRELTQKQAADLCGIDQPTLSKVLRGRMESVTFDRLISWLTALDRIVEIRVRPYGSKAATTERVVRVKFGNKGLAKGRRPAPTRRIPLHPSAL